MRRKRRSKKHSLMLRVAAFVLAGLFGVGMGVMLGVFLHGHLT